MLMQRLAVALALLGAVFTTQIATAGETLKLAVTDVEGMERLQTEWGPFKAALEKASGEKLKFFPVSNRTAAAEALRAKHVDFVISGPAEYVVINKMTDAKPMIGLGRPDYFCGIIVRADSGISHPSQLKGKKVAFSDVGSTSGHLCPMQLLADYGIDPLKDIERIHTKRNIMHESLKRGDIAAIGYNHNSWIARARNKDTSVPAGFFRIIARSGDLPNDMIMVGAHVDAAIAEKFKKSILEHKNDIIAGIVSHEENKKYSGMDLYPVKDNDYNVVRSMYKTIGHPQYSSFVGD
jgi:phosphonate transport system substrate-binding protein